jgi:mannosyltransferase
MAIAKPIRFMAGATMLLFVFLLYNMIRDPVSIDGLVGPNEAQRKDDMLRDPNLDGMAIPPGTDMHALF